MGQRKKTEQNVKSEITVLKIKIEKKLNLKSNYRAVNIINQLMCILIGF